MAIVSRLTAKSNIPFLLLFGAYTAGSIFLLFLGAGAAVATFFPRVLAAFQAWGQSGDLFGLLARAMAQASRLSASPGRIGIDYALSLLNLAVGIFMVLRRPWDWVSRLLGLGMVGTAMAFNFQAHSVVAVASQTASGLRSLFVYHFVLHAISGATYVHALLLFPNGKLVPRRFIWLMVVIYILMVEEIAFPVLKYAYGSSLFIAPAARTAATSPLQAVLFYWLSVNGGGLLMSILHIGFGIQAPLSTFGPIIQAETAFFILLYGLLIPVVGVASQVYRYRFVSSLEERQQTKLVVWALASSFTVGMLFFLLAGLVTAEETAHLDFSTLERLEESSSWIFPPLFAVIPISLVIAIWRSRLFDIDLVINRALVYFPLTAIVAGVFAALTNIMQRVFLALTGAQSEVAVIISALLAAATFAPIRAYLQKEVDEHFRTVPELIPGSNSLQTLEANRSEHIQDNVRILLESAVRSFDAAGGAAFWGSDEPLEPFHTCGDWKGEGQLSVHLESHGVRLGRICLGARRNGAEYTSFDEESLKRAANLVAGAIHLVQK